jgi:hypothetical protein
MDALLNYYDNMKRLEEQGAPLDWRRISDVMANLARSAQVPTRAPEPETPSNNS